MLIEDTSSHIPSNCYHVKNTHNGIFHSFFCHFTNKTMLKKFGQGSEYYTETTELDLKRSHM